MMAVAEGKQLAGRFEGPLAPAVPALRQCGAPCTKGVSWGARSGRGRRGWWLRWRDTRCPGLVCHAMPCSTFLHPKPMLLFTLG